VKGYLVSSGTELLLGQTVNTNATYLGQQLAGLGIDLHTVITIGDNLERLAEAIRQGGEAADLVIVSGGLGPTEDDISREALALALNITLQYHPTAKEVTERFFTRRGLDIPKVNERQFLAPSGAVILDNPFGTAPGVYYERHGKIYILLPGPPRELIPMFENELLPLLHNKSAGTVIFSRVLKVAGIGEPAAEAKIKDLIHSANPTVAPAAKRGEIHFRITAKAEGIEAAKNLIAPLEKAIRERLGSYVFGQDQDSLEGVVAGLLREKGLTIGVAESCTGGLVAHRLTNIPGSSDYFQLGIVAYHNLWKESLLNVSGEVLRAKGAVSPEVAIAMAKGIRAKANTSIGLSVTGIAGPGGATAEKPVGLVYSGIDFGDRQLVFKEQLVGSRQDIKWRSSQWALMQLYQELKKN